MGGLSRGKGGLNPELVAVLEIGDLANVEGLLAAGDADAEAGTVEIEVGASAERRAGKSKSARKMATTEAAALNGDRRIMANFDIANIVGACAAEKKYAFYLRYVGVPRVACLLARKISTVTGERCNWKRKLELERSQIAAVA